MIWIIATYVSTSFALGGAIGSVGLYRNLLAAEDALARKKAAAKKLDDERCDTILKLAGDLERLHDNVDELTIERNTAWRKLAIRSDGIARGNRTRALRRRGGLLPAPINDTFQEGQLA